MYNFMEALSCVPASNSGAMCSCYRLVRTDGVASDQLLVPGKQLGALRAHQDRIMGNSLTVPPLDEELG